jgi:hypothetical protein
MKDQRHLWEALKNKNIFVVLIILFFLSCINKKDDQSTVNINIYGGYKNRESIRLLIDGSVVFNQIIERPYFESRRIIYKTSKKNKIKIFFSVAGKDTSFNLEIKKMSYLKLALSRANHLFLVNTVDSVAYWNNGID